MSNNDKEKTAELQESSDQQQASADQQEISPELVEINELIKEVDFWRNKSIHAVADFENYKRRAAKDFELQRDALYATVFGDLLSVADDLDRACNQPVSQSQDAQALHTAIGMINNALQAIFRKCGIREISTTGQFDPLLHEAVAHVDQEGFASGAIVSVVNKGYLLGEKVLRAALVAVAK